MSKFRLVKTAVIFFVAISVGVSIGVIPTTLPDMEVRTSTQTAKMSTIFIWMGLARMLGAMATGPLFDYVNGMLVLSVCLLLYGVALGLAPTWQTLTAFKALVAVATAFDASLSSGCMAIIQNMWKTSPAWMRSVIHTTNLVSILGMAIGPQIARPFLGWEVRTPAADAANVTTSTPISDGRLHPVQVIYLIVGALNVGMAVVCAAVCSWSCAGGSGSKLRACFVDDAEDDNVQVLGDTQPRRGRQPADKLEPSSRRGFTLLLVAVLFGFMFGGYAAVLTGLVFTYLYEYLGWSVHASAVLLTSRDTAQFISCGVVMFLVPWWMSPTRQMIVDVVALLAASLLMSAALLHESVAFLTGVGLVVVGVGSYNTCATVITLLAESVHVGAPALAAVYSSFGLGSVMLPPVAGTLLYRTGAVSYPLLLLALAVAGIALFALYGALSRPVKNE